MASTLRHDLRTPLNHIIGYCELLLEEADDRRLGAFVPDLQRIHSAGKRLLAVINDLFDPAKASSLLSNQSLIHHEVRTPLNQILGYVELLQEDARAAQQAELGMDLQKIDKAARDLLRLVVERLLTGEPSSELLQAANRSANTAFLRRPAATPRPAEPPALTGTLLVVDDDESNREMLSRRLARLGHRVSLATNGREALARLQEASFDLVLLDLQMPEMNGYEVLEHLKADPVLQTLPVLVLSASDETERVAHCIEMGAADYLAKPFDPVLLQARISACLEKKRLRDREQLHLHQIQEEQTKSERLLLNVLPPVIAGRLKHGEQGIADSFTEATVLFADLVGFTSFSTSHPPGVLLEILNEIFSAFDAAVQELQLEKIKTIGDAYMAVGGVPVAQPDHAERVVTLGFRMLEEIDRFNQRRGMNLQIRVGVHTGPVIAGIIGQHKFIYDLWGVTVNTASRMESHSAPGRIQVSAAVRELLQEKFEFEPRGAIPIKGRSPMETFFCRGKKTGASAGS